MLSLYSIVKISLGNIDLNVIQKLLDEDETMMILSYIADGPGINLYLSNEHAFMTFEEKKDVMSENVSNFIESINVSSSSEKFDNRYAEIPVYLGGLEVVESKNNKRKSLCHF